MRPVGFIQPHQQEARVAFRAFADRELRPHANAFDREEALPRALIARMATEGYLGTNIPAEYGGRPMDAVTYGLLHEEIGAACSSTRSLLTVHGMVCHAIATWGTPDQATRLLPALARGERLAAFALSEPEVGSDARAVRAVARTEGDRVILNGSKKWTSFGEIADLLLVLAGHERGPVALLVDASRDGVTRRPTRGMLGTRASMLAEIDFHECVIPAQMVLKRPGFGLQVIGSALDMGRFSVAWGCVGIGQACLEACESYSRERVQFGRPIAEHQLVARMLADMIAGVRASRALCLQAALARAADATSAIADTLVAKYFASTTAMKLATHAVQIHGANGCSADYPVARYLRDAKTMEIIEGSNEIQQMLIARHAHMEVQHPS